MKNLKIRNFIVEFYNASNLNFWGILIKELIQENSQKTHQYSESNIQKASHHQSCFMMQIYVMRFYLNNYKFTLVAENVYVKWIRMKECIMIHKQAMICWINYEFSCLFTIIECMRKKEGNVDLSFEEFPSFILYHGNEN